jgi:hypothetical protein
MKSFLTSLALVLALPVALHAQVINSLTVTASNPSTLTYNTSPSDPYWAQFGVSGTDTGTDLVNVMSGASSAVTLGPLTVSGDTAFVQNTSGIDFVYANGSSPVSSATNSAGEYSVATDVDTTGAVLTFTLTFNQAVSEGTLDLVANDYQASSTFDFTFSNGATKPVDDPVPPFNNINGYYYHNDDDVYTLSFSDVPVGSILTVTDTEVSSIPDNGGNTTITGLAFTVLDVPEPSTWAMLLAGLAFLGFRIRRRSIFRS